MRLGAMTDLQGKTALVMRRAVSAGPQQSRWQPEALTYWLSDVTNNEPRTWPRLKQAEEGARHTGSPR
jgi:hypothetical protein